MNDLAFIRVELVSLTTTMSSVRNAVMWAENNSNPLEIDWTLTNSYHKKMIRFLNSKLDGEIVPGLQLNRFTSRHHQQPAHSLLHLPRQDSPRQPKPRSPEFPAERQREPSPARQPSSRRSPGRRGRWPCPGSPHDRFVLERIRITERKRRRKLSHQSCGRTRPPRAACRS